MRFKKHEEQEVKVTFYDVAAGRTGKERVSTLESKYSTKETVNLCMKDRKDITFELFFLLLALILVILLIVEFFGIYRPYLSIEKAEAQLAADQAKLEQLQDSMRDYNDVHEQYRKYNYENFDRSIVDREDILDMLEDKVFSMGIIQSISISRNTLTMTLTGVNRNEIDAMQAGVREDPIVFNVFAQSTGYDEGIVTVNMSIIFKDATTIAGGN